MSEPLPLRLNLEQIAAWLAMRQPIWQLRVLDPDGLSSLAREHGVLISSEHITALWKLGLLNADLVLADGSFPPHPYFPVIRQDEENRSVMADTRRAIESVQPDPPSPDARPLFHPFRFVVLADLDWYCVQRLTFWPRLPPSVAPQLGNLRGWFDVMHERPTTVALRSRIQRVNEVAALAVATEPCFYPFIIGRRSIPLLDIDRDDYAALVKTHWQNLLVLYRELNREAVARARDFLCITASELDENRHLHRLLRLANYSLRNALRGRLAGAMDLLTMAEVIRRGAEEAWDTTLPEEDELGFGSGRSTPNIKKDLYGAERVFEDADAKHAVVRRAGLDYAIQLRWYVEGSTERGFLDTLIEEYGVRHVQVVNLTGQVVERAATAFVASLRSDVEAAIFSLISVDGDRQDFVRALRKAAKDDIFCGELYVSQPDFEFANFDARELGAVLWKHVGQHYPAADEQGLYEAVAAVESMPEFIDAARRILPGLRSVKSAVWGRALGRYYLTHRSRPNGADRPITSGLDHVRWARTYNFLSTRRGYRTDPGTGKLVPRSTTAPAVG